jgi:hypothetical protein
LNSLNSKGLPRKDYANFKNARPEELKPGTKIYRIVDEKAPDAGGYWATELPKNKTEWRRDYAVKDSWNDNGYYVEYVVPEGPNGEGLKVWRGEAAGQRYEDGAFYLSGGKEQIFVDPTKVNPSPPKLTEWPEM